MKTGEARFVDVYDAYYRLVRAYCRRRLSPERVDDAVAETFLTAWRRIDSIPEGEEALPWLYSVAHRVVGHQWRKAARVARLQDRIESLPISHEPPADDFLIVSDDAALALNALSALRRMDQEVLRLSVWEELNHLEIAQVLAISHDAVKKRYSRAKRNLARELDRLATKSPPAAQKGGAW